MMVAPAIAAGLLVSIGVTPAAAANCVLNAPGTVEVGAPLAIIGTGFPASSSIDIELAVEGGTADQFSVQSDAAGGFQFSLTPAAADVGKTKVVATAGSACSVQVISTVLGPNDTPSAPSAPRSDAAAPRGEGPAGPPLNAGLLAVLVMLLGMTGLIATRPTRSR